MPESLRFCTDNVLATEGEFTKSEDGVYYKMSLLKHGDYTYHRDSPVGDIDICEGEVEVGDLSKLDRKQPEFLNLQG